MPFPRMAHTNPPRGEGWPALHTPWRLEYLEALDTREKPGGPLAYPTTPGPQRRIADSTEIQAIDWAKSGESRTFDVTLLRVRQ